MRHTAPPKRLWQSAPHAEQRKRGPPSVRGCGAGPGPPPALRAHGGREEASPPDASKARLSLRSGPCLMFLLSKGFNSQNQLGRGEALTADASARWWPSETEIGSTL